MFTLLPITWRLEDTDSYRLLIGRHCRCAFRRKEGPERYNKKDKQAEEKPVRKRYAVKLTRKTMNSSRLRANWFYDTMSHNAFAFMSRFNDGEANDLLWASKEVYEDLSFATQLDSCRIYAERESAEHRCAPWWVQSNDMDCTMGRLIWLLQKWFAFLRNTRLHWYCSLLANKSTRLAYSLKRSVFFRSTMTSQMVLSFQATMLKKSSCENRSMETSYDASRCGIRNPQTSRLLPRREGK